MAPGDAGGLQFREDFAVAICGPIISMLHDKCARLIQRARARQYSAAPMEVPASLAAG